MLRIPAVVVCCALSAAAADRTALEIVRRSCEREARHLQIRQQYIHRQSEQVRMLDGKGGVKGTKRKTEEILWLDGSRYERLVAKDGKPLSADEEAAEQRKFEEAVAKRKRESASDRQKRLAREAKELEDERQMRRQIPEAFTFAVAGEEKVGGRDCWRVTAEPRPSFKGHGRAASLLPKVRGTLWIDKTDFEWAKIDAETLDTISVGLGLFRVGKGARLYVEQSLVNNELWTPVLFRMKASARALFVKGWNVEVEAKLHDFRKYSVESTVTVASVE